MFFDVLFLEEMRMEDALKDSKLAKLMFKVIINRLSKYDSKFSKYKDELKNFNEFIKNSNFFNDYVEFYKKNERKAQLAVYFGLGTLVIISILIILLLKGLLLFYMLKFASKLSKSIQILSRYGNLDEKTIDRLMDSIGLRDIDELDKQNYIMYVNLNILTACVIPAIINAVSKTFEDFTNFVIIDVFKLFYEKTNIAWFKLSAKLFQIISDIFDLIGPVNYLIRLRFATAIDITKKISNQSEIYKQLKDGLEKIKKALNIDNIDIKVDVILNNPAITTLFAKVSKVNDDVQKLLLEFKKNLEQVMKNVETEIVTRKLTKKEIIIEFAKPMVTQLLRLIVVKLLRKYSETNFGRKFGVLAVNLVLNTVENYIISCSLKPGIGVSHGELFKVKTKYRFA